jgi:glutamate synthase domain-containing protein 2/glutamate synthase domain-containing protein 1/glutamate synthase domain-containing protein 3
MDAIAGGRGNVRGLTGHDFERGNCGVGFVARLDAVPRHDVVAHGVQVLVNLEHRGAVGGDKATGDGAGLLLQLPDRFLRAAAAAAGAALPPAGEYGVAMVFLPPGAEAAARAADLLERVAREEGLAPLFWREVPVAPDHLGDFSRATLPAIRQLVVARGRVGADALERALYVARRRAEREAAGWGEPDRGFFYVPSFSARTVLYKGMLTGTQLLPFYRDLADPAFESAFAIVHQRYSTNTLPSWPLSQPFRFLAHNGEINTLRGNVNRMRAREAILSSPLFGADIAKILPVIDESGSDSAMLDNALELLVLGGRSLPHAMMMLIPEAWGQRYQMSEDRRAFYEYHAAIMEPWDGPAAVACTDGRYIGGILDRNGLRPARWTITTDGLVVLASESGVIEVPAERIAKRGRLQPGRMFLVDLEEHRVVPDREIKAAISRRRPYRNWVYNNRIELRGLFTPPEASCADSTALRARQHAFGYTEEELRMVLAPMAANGQEAVGSMGNDAALAVLSERPRLVFDYFRQLFAQVTNPPIDPLREELVMSLMTFAGRQRNLLDETPEHVRQLKLRVPFLTPDDLARIRASGLPDVQTADLDMTFPAGGDGAALEAALDGLFRRAGEAIAAGATILVLTDRATGPERVPVPALLAVSGLHHHLIRAGLRNHAGIILEGGEPREVMHFCLLLAYGANAVCPTTAFATVCELAETALLEKRLTATQAHDNYVTALKKGLLKTFSRMGISTLRSFFGSQIFEAVGLGPALVERYFTGTPSRIGGIGLPEVAAEAIARHRRAWPPDGAAAAPLLDTGGDYHVRAGGERHLLTPEAISRLHEAVRRDRYDAFCEYERLINESAGATTLRGCLRFTPGTPVPLDEVEPVERIFPRFVSAAMSFGSISQEAHEAIAIAMNRLGAQSNCGEGGEDPARAVPLPNGDSKRSKVKQVASGRFGVTLQYLRSADELQIKVAQGAKPGEGGQLPGHKVSRDIARVRHTTPYVTLISPPPHHDIYSIEDLAQLIHDLKTANPAARISVKLVSECGVGTIASGVAKAKADMVLISGADGGTGASPLTAIKHCGLPWELGIAETQQSLVANRLRDRIRVQVDGQLRTARDLAVAALLGAEEFGFGTVVLLALGCVMMRKCQLNTCPVGVATQDPELRRRFGGAAEHVERYFRHLARSLRALMAELGFRTIDEMVGRSERLEPADRSWHPKARLLDLAAIIRPRLDPPADAPRRAVRAQEHAVAAHFDHELIRLAQPALAERRPVAITLPVRNVHRTVGTLLAGEIVARHGAAGLPDGTIRVELSGSAGQSLGAFLPPGVTLRVVGDANDYLGKGLSGGRIVVVPPSGSTFLPHESIIAGNVILYGATAGEVFLHGMAGERFGVRNSGATAVVEGVGDHGCEYMTGGTVVVLGHTGVNFAAGMSGGIAYVYDESGLFDTRCNLDMVDLETVWNEEDRGRLRGLIERHLALTGSPRASAILGNWEAHLPLFVKVMPIEYRTSLERMRLEEQVQPETVPATEEVFVDSGPPERGRRGK